MTTGNLYADLFIYATLSQLFWNFIYLIPKAKQRAIAANQPFSLYIYLKADYAALIASFLAILIGVGCVDQFVVWKPESEPFLKVIAVMYGALGSSILKTLIGKFDKKLLQTVDEKTNFADMVQAERDEQINKNK